MSTIAVVKTGEKIRVERRKRLMTQDVLAAEAGISQKALSKIENDEVEPRVSTLQKLATALDIDARNLLED
jgi:transcriptional regulator with XRE-family HTH domain